MLVPEISVEKMIADQIKYFESFDVLDKPTVFLDLQDINPQLIRYDMGYNIGPFYVRGHFTLISSGLHLGHYEYVSPHTDHVDVLLDGDGLCCYADQKGEKYRELSSAPTFDSVKVLIDWIKANDLHLNVMKFKSASMRHEITK